jgi:hypothetical protein
MYGIIIIKKSNQNRNIKKANKMKERFIYNSRKEAFEDVLKSFKDGD